MDKDSSILLTGAAGFIGSYLLGYLNRKGFENILIVDDFTDLEKRKNWETKMFRDKIERTELFKWLKANDSANDPVDINFVFHLGARTDTTEFDYAVHEKLNVEYSKKIWNYCSEKNIPLLYASSAATYGSGESGYKDDHELVEKLQPLNPYGISKNEFDKWALRQFSTGPILTGPSKWAGLKFFNVYGPNEYHKGRMASMVFHGFKQIQLNGKVKLFKSHQPEFKDGEQLRDFIYVEDVAAVCFWMMNNSWPSGLYNLGTGKARTFNDLIKAIFSSLDISFEIDYIDMPEDIRDKYQYYTEAEMDKLRQVGYTKDFYSIEEGVKEYVKNYLDEGLYY